ncbi:MAG: hypothetical protein R3F60_21390 [bacterium]
MVTKTLRPPWRRNQDEELLHHLPAQALPTGGVVQVGPRQPAGPFGALDGPQAGQAQHLAVPLQHVLARHVPDQGLAGNLMIFF